MAVASPGHIRATVQGGGCRPNPRTTETVYFPSVCRSLGWYGLQCSLGASRGQRTKDALCCQEARALGAFSANRGFPRPLLMAMRGREASCAGRDPRVMQLSGSL